jgi:hypothetical protein
MWRECIHSFWMRADLHSSWKNTRMNLCLMKWVRTFCSDYKSTMNQPNIQSRTAGQATLISISFHHHKIVVFEINVKGRWNFRSAKNILYGLWEIKDFWHICNGSCKKCAISFVMSVPMYVTIWESLFDIGGFY